MANYLTLPQCFLLLLCFYLSAIVSGHTVHAVLPHSFPNERLYRAYLVIQRFKSTITSDPKKVTATWNGHDICGDESYLGFFCSTPTGRSDDLAVIAIIWNGYGLRAPTLQGFVDQLPDLALFHAASNYFGSDIPRLDILPYLYNLNVNDDLPAHPEGNDAFVGADGGFQTPCINGNIHLRINVTMKSPKKKKWGWGMIPGGAGATNARALLLNYNSLSGPLPANLGLSKLSYLALANNKLTGPIPPSVQHLQDSLLEVLLLNNQLSGCLPQELGMLTRAAVIDAGMNQLTGPIPSSFSCLTSVEQLNLGSNRLYGEIPEALCKLAAGPAGRLANLTLSSNYFTSVGPSCLPLIKDGVLNIKNNCIPGFANQRRPAECASFLSKVKTCPAASATHVACPAAAANIAAAPAERVAKDYSTYVTYATLHE